MSQGPPEQLVILSPCQDFSAFVDYSQKSNPPPPYWLCVYILSYILCICRWQSEVKWKSLSCVPTRFDPMDYTAHGILQARILEWVAFPFCRGSSQPRDQTQVSHIADGFFTSWAARETHLQVGWAHFSSNAHVAGTSSLSVNIL